MLECISGKIASGLCVDNASNGLLPCGERSCFQRCMRMIQGDTTRRMLIYQRVVEISPIEALSHAFTLAAILTALGQFVS